VAESEPDCPEPGCAWQLDPPPLELPPGFSLQEYRAALADNHRRTEQLVEEHAQWHRQQRKPQPLSGVDLFGARDEDSDTEPWPAETEIGGRRSRAYRRAHFEPVDADGGLSGVQPGG
jgi:hypothetical protein